MAISLLYLLIYSFIQTFALSAPNHLQSYQNKQDKHTPKSRHLTFYVQETTNKTFFYTTRGVKCPKHIAAKSSNSFGSQFVFNELITETPDPSSKALGYVTGLGVLTSCNGDETTKVCRTSLNMKGLKGDIMNVGNGKFTKSSEFAVVGGTKDFRFVQGYMTTSVIDHSGATTRFKIEYHLYWPSIML